MYFRRRFSKGGRVKLYEYSCHREGKKVVRKYIGTATFNDEAFAIAEREEKRELGSMRGEKNAIQPEMTSRSPLTIDLPSSSGLPPMPSSRPAGTVTKGSGGERAVDVLPRGDWILLGVVAKHWAEETGEKGSETILGVLEDQALALAGAPPVPSLVGSLAVTAAICWYEYMVRSMAIRAGKFRNPDVVDTRVTRAFRRWMEAARTLANVQRLKLTVQVNIAHGPQQVVKNNPG